jgi:hypothetical protein
VIDVPNLRAKVSSIRSMTVSMQEDIEAGRRRSNGAYELFCAPIARALFHATADDMGAAETAAHILLGLLDVMDGFFTIVESQPHAAERLRSLMNETASLIYAEVMTLSAPTTQAMKTHEPRKFQRLNRKRRA